MADDGSASPADPAGSQSRARAALNPLSIAGNMEYDRVLFFSDAVFAIAITLLVVDIRVPEVVKDARHQLHEARLQILGFVISFLVIGLFWMGHHRLFRYIPGGVRRPGRGAVHVDPAPAHRPGTAPHHARERDERGR